MTSDPAVKYNQTIFGRSYLFEYTLIVLTVLSFLLVFINSNYKRTTVLTFDPNQSTVITDSIKPNGASTAQVDPTNPYSFKCNLIKSQYRNIFCAYQIYLGVSDTQGYDFSDFDDLLVDIDYQGPSDSIRIQLLNYNSACALVDGCNLDSLPSASFICSSIFLQLWYGNNRTKIFRVR